MAKQKVYQPINSQLYFRKDGSVHCPKKGIAVKNIAYNCDLNKRKQLHGTTSNLTPEECLSYSMSPKETRTETSNSQNQPSTSVLHTESAGSCLNDIGAHHKPQLQFDQAYITATIKQNEQKLPRLIEPEQLLRQDCDNIYLQPRLIVWNPLRQLHIQLKCPFHFTDLTISCKEIASSRKIYHTDGIVHLYAKHYCCNGGLAGKKEKHDIIASDEGIYQQVRNVLQPCFRLSQRSGMTQALYEYVGHR